MVKPDLSILILNESISSIGASGEYFYFYCILHKNSCKQTLLTLIRCCAWVCNVKYSSKIFFFPVLLGF